MKFAEPVNDAGLAAIEEIEHARSHGKYPG